MKTQDEPAYFVAAKLLAVAYSRCYVSYEQPKIGLDNRENKSVTRDNKERQTRSLRKEKKHE